MVDLGIFALIVGIPLVVIAVSADLKRPLRAEIGNEEDYKRDLSSAKNNWGLDLYLGGLSILIASTIFTFKGAVPLGNYLAVVFYLISFAVLARLYKVFWAKRNWCLTFSFIVFGGGMAYSLYLLLIQSS